MKKRKRPTKKKIFFKSHLKNVIRDVLLDRGYIQLPQDSPYECNFMWVSVSWIRDEFDELRYSMLADQKVNHFRNYYELCRKDLLYKNLKRKKKEMDKKGKFEEGRKFLNIQPKTFSLPSEYISWVNEYKNTIKKWKDFRNFHSHKPIYICKPISCCQGQGIFLINTIKQLNSFSSLSKFQNSKLCKYIIQKYIESPLLIGGKKFDMRIYALVINYNPLIVYLYKDGFARFSSKRFTLRNIKNIYVHLTNVAIQKTSKDYDKRGCKWFMRELRMYMCSKYGYKETTICFNKIQEIILRSLCSVQGVMLTDKHCFELYGFDIIIDSMLNPYILEVNASPSLSASTNKDYVLKHHLLDDMLSVLDLEQIKNGNEKEIGGFHLICNSNNPNFKAKTMLGTKNNREKNLSSFFKSEKFCDLKIRMRKRNM